MEGIPKVSMGQKRISFGLYVMVNIGTTSTIQRRYVTEIALKAPNNYGGCYFMNIFTRKLVHRYNWK